MIVGLQTTIEWDPLATYRGVVAGLQPSVARLFSCSR
jgi:hypothetical protein